MSVTFDDILAARARIRGGIYHSPCPTSMPLSEVTGATVYCKLDNLQRTGSFKERGARNALLLLDDTQRNRGVIAASAGNHALGLAYHGKLAGVPVTVVMPVFAPVTKVATCRQLGATVLLHGENVGEAKDKAMQVAVECGLKYINGYDDPAVIAGQGTMGLEIVDQVPELDAVIVPVGGGGLIAGVALAIKSREPRVTVIGVSAERTPSAALSFAAGKAVDAHPEPTLADGLAVPRVGANALAIAKPLVDKIVTVSEPQIALAVLRLMELEKSVVEGAGATPLAALLSGKLPELAGKRVVLPLTGGNIDLTVIGRIIERGLAADGRLCRFDARISDRPGGLAKLAALIAETGASIKEVEHDRSFSGEDLAAVVVHVVAETRDAEHVKELHRRLTAAGFTVHFPDLAPMNADERR